MTRSIITFQLRPGCRAEFLEVFQRAGVLELSSFQAGYLGGTLLAAVDDPNSAMVIAEWESPAAYQGWLDNPVREGTHDQLSPFWVAEPEGRAFEIVHDVAPRTEVPE